MTIKKALVLYSNQDCDLLLSFVLKKTKEFLYLNPEHEIPETKLIAFKKLVSQRIKGKPIAYLLGYKYFYGLKFKVTKDTLIPRPETELLIDEILSYCHSDPPTGGREIYTSIIEIPHSAQDNSKIRILDIGTGSGCIAISLAKNLSANITASDISAKALKIAKANAKAHHVKVKFVQSNLLSNLKNKKLDLIVANLPYGWREWKNNTTANTRGLKFEPPQALFTGKMGLALIEQFLKEVNSIPHQPRLILLEFDHRQKIKLTALIKKQFPKSKSIFKKDLNGRWRMVCIYQ
jgi:release factor glutamine methyltransferase